MPLKPWSGLRFKLLLVVLIPVVPAIVLLARDHDTAAVIGLALLALLIAGVGAEWLVLDRTRALRRAAQRLREGDYSARVAAGEAPVGDAGDELGELSRAFDDMAAAIAARRAERDEAERALRESEQRFRAVARATNDVVWDWDLASGGVWWSEGLRAVLGYDTAAAGGMDWRLERIHPDDRARVEEQLVRAPHGNDLVWHGEYRFRHADGHWLDVDDRGFVIRDADGRPQRMIGAMLDVTSQRRAEEQMRTFARSLEKRVGERTRELADANEELATEIRQRQRAEARIRTSQEELREYIDRMATLNAKVAPDGRLLLVNRIAESASGFTHEQLLEMNFLEGPWWTFDAEVQERVKRAFARALAGEAIRYDERLWVFDREIIIDFGLAPVRDPDGRVAFIVAEARDITAQKEAEQALQLRTAELEEANKELEAFSYTVSHDLRAPLRAVDGFSRILLEEEGTRVSEEGLALMRRIRDNAQQMGALIADLLSFSRLSRQPLQLRAVKPAALAREVLAELGEDDDRVVEVRIGDLPEAQADPALLKQVFVNLLSNALKYTRGRAVAEIEIGARNGPDAERIYFVRDNGVGFDMRYADRLFGVFQRLHRAEEFEGTGVGLAIAQRIVYRHGGRIWAESEPGRGATFYFTLGTHS